MAILQLCDYCGMDLNLIVKCSFGRGRINWYQTQECICQNTYFIKRAREYADQMATTACLIVHDRSAHDEY